MLLSCAILLEAACGALVIPAAHFDEVIACLLSEVPEEDPARCYADLSECYGHCLKDDCEHDISLKAQYILIDVAQLLAVLCEVIRQARKGLNN